MATKQLAVTETGVLGCIGKPVNKPSRRAPKSMA